MSIRSDLKDIRKLLGMDRTGPCPGQLVPPTEASRRWNEPDPPLPEPPLCNRCGERHWSPEQGIVQIVTVCPPERNDADYAEWYEQACRAMQGETPAA
jgi:hypothetical protein